MRTKSYIAYKDKIFVEAIRYLSEHYCKYGWEIHSWKDIQGEFYFLLERNDSE